MFPPQGNDDFKFISRKQSTQISIYIFVVVALGSSGISMLGPPSAKSITEAYPIYLTVLAVTC